ncbi:MAG: DNA-3-methyladenine glycosylase [bacterium]|nr:DNA-3-methyladenine glycosylase [bacterium]
MTASKILSSQFFKNKNTIKIAKQLLGKFLMRRYRGKTRAYIITEVEAYDGFKDKASHAHLGKTERNKIMFGDAGHWYVYFTYGMHWMLNIVTGPKEYPAAILIRSVRIAGRPESSRRTALNSPEHGRGTTINGPARLTKALHIDKKFNGKKADKKSGLWIAASNPLRRASPKGRENRRLNIGNPPSPKASADDSHSFKRMRIKKSPRVGVDYAGPIWAKKLYRFSIS